MPDPDDTQLIEIDAAAIDAAADDLRDASRAVNSTARAIGSVRIDHDAFGVMNAYLATATFGLAGRATELARLTGDVLGALGAAASDVAEDWRVVEQGVSDSLALAKADLEGARELL